MEELRETSVHHTALKFSDDIKQMKVYSNLFKTVQVRKIEMFAILVSCSSHVKRASKIPGTGNINQQCIFCFRL